MKKIKIEIEKLEFDAELLDTPTGNKIYEALPFQGQAQTWGDEIYFSIPVNYEEEPDAREVVEIGDLGFWPVGSAFCIFFGPTPVSRGDESRAASPVNVFGKIVGEVEELKKVNYGSLVKVSKK